MFIHGNITSQRKVNLSFLHILTLLREVLSQQLKLNQRLLLGCLVKLYYLEQASLSLLAKVRDMGLDRIF